MESINYHEEYINSSHEEVVDHHHHHSDEESKDLGVGRSYECVFCKRGFNTAQALGGHMNIHRKDRARKPNNNSNINHQDHVPRLYHQIIPSSTADIQSSSNHRRFSPQDHHQPILSYATYFPAPSASTSSRSSYHHQNDSDRDHQQPLDVHGDWRMRLSLEFPPLDLEKEMNQEKDLDLELRLGYHS